MNDERLNGFQAIDRRENPRKRFEVRLILSPLKTTDFHLGSIKDISMGGIGVITGIQPSHFAREEEVRVFINTDYFAFDGIGKVVWTSDIKSEVGINFTRLAEGARRSLEKFLRLLP